MPACSLLLGHLTGSSPLSILKEWLLLCPSFFYFPFSLLGISGLIWWGFWFFWFFGGFFCFFFFCFCFWFGLTLQLWAWNPGSCQAWQGSATFPACCSAALNLWVGQQLSLSPATLLWWLQAWGGTICPVPGGTASSLGASSLCVYSRFHFVPHFPEGPVMFFNF